VIPEMQFVDSSNLEQIGYAGDEMELHVIFHGGAHYIYHDVPPQIFEGLADASSKGSYLNREIKGVYTFTLE
jgi:KTSC domain